MVTATVNDVSATVTYESSAGACPGGVCPVTAPQMWVTATVTAADGATRQEYTILVTEAAAGASSDAWLSGLEIAPGSLSPAFVSSTLAYSANVPNGTVSVMVTATVNDVSATVTYESSAGACPGGACPVTAPQTWVTATVTAADGATRQEYVIEVKVLPSMDTALSGLEIAPGELTPEFVSTTTEYTAELENLVSSVIVTPTLNQAHEVYTITGSPETCSPAMEARERT
jgi:hypothetical protein